MTGRINLYHMENLLRTNIFNTEAHRLELIATWKKLYGKGFERTTVVTVYDKRKKEKEPEVELPASNYKRGALPTRYKIRVKQTGKLRYS